MSLLNGGFPEVLAHPSARRTWFRSYVQTYLERDVRAVTSIRDLATFRRFLGLLASRCGQMLNKTDLAAPLGVSVPTVTSWLSAALRRRRGILLSASLLRYPCRRAPETDTTGGPARPSSSWVTLLHPWSEKGRTKKPHGGFRKSREADPEPSTALQNSHAV